MSEIVGWLQLAVETAALLLMIYQTVGMLPRRHRRRRKDGPTTTVWKICVERTRRRDVTDETDS